MSGLQVQLFNDPDDFELVYGPRPHHPVGHKSGVRVRIGYGSGHFNFRGEDIFRLAHLLVHAKVAYERHQALKEIRT